MGEGGRSREELQALAELLEGAAQLREYRRWNFFTPYPKQREFLDAGAKCRERLFMAGNRVGKTECGAFEATCHLTGEYPGWWRGRKFDRPTRMWACGETSLSTRDVVQTKLCGEPGVESRWGAGMIPRDLLVDKSLARGITDSIDTIHVKHRTGGISICRFKSYEQGREKFQGEGLDCVWFDEEPPAKIYSEGLTRIGERAGLVWITFTPMLGDSELVLRFVDEASADRFMVQMTLAEALHIKPEEKKRMEEGYLAYERDARVRGIPLRGEGRVFTASEEQIAEPPLEYIPSYWTKIWGIDPGIHHPFGAVLMLWDKDNDCLHVHQAIRMKDALPIAHAHAMKQVAAGVPVAWPKDAADRDMGSGIPLARQYKQHGLLMLPHHAQWEDGGYSTMAGIMEMDERMKTGRFKVARQLNEWWEEYRMYHYKDGQIVKLKDDLLSATRHGVMMKRFGKAVGLGRVAGQMVGAQKYASGLDFDLHAV